MKNAAKSTATINRRQFMKTLFAGTAATALIGTSDVEACILSRKVNDVEAIDPILAGKNIIFSERWLPIIGNNRDTQVTPQQFRAWIDQLDTVFNTYEGFVGRKPHNQRGIIVVDLIPQAELMTSTSPSGVGNAHEHNNGVICINRDSEYFKWFLSNIRTQSTPTRLMLHEMAHSFASIHFKPSPWAECEAAVNFLMSYAMEKGGFKYGIPPDEISGIRHRRDRIQWAINNLRAGNIKDFDYGCGTAYDLYLLGLPNVVGWDTVKAAVRSYQDNQFEVTKTSAPSGREQGTRHANARSLAHELFDRVAHFHDEARANPELARNIPRSGQNLTGAQALRSLPDKGELLDKYFTVATTPIQQNRNTQVARTRPTPRPATPAASQAQSVSTPPPPAQDAEPLINPRTGKPLPARWTNPNL